MPRIFVHAFSVPADAIDVANHVNNLAYLRWMQEVAIQHSAARGWPMERYLALGQAWVVRSHFIEYLRPAFLGEAFSLITYVCNLKRQSSLRRYLFYRPADQQVVARAETNWVFVKLADGRPTPIPDELGRSFELIPDEEDVLVTLGLRPAGG